MPNKLGFYFVALWLFKYSHGFCMEVSQEDDSPPSFLLKIRKTEKTDSSGTLEEESLSTNERAVEVSQVWKILIVDDNAFLRKVLARLIVQAFKGSGFLDIVEVNDGDEALPKLNTDKFSLVFMDNHMERMNGIDATRDIRKTYETLPIIGYSSDDQQEVRDAFIEAGANQFLSKNSIGVDLSFALERIFNEYLKIDEPQVTEAPITLTD